MAGWRDVVLREFQPEVSALFIAADPDLLLADEDLHAELASRGFDVLVFDDPVAFRLIHESRYRSVLDGGQQLTRSIIVQVAARPLDQMPYDILQAGREVRLGLNNIFSGLSYPVLTSLDRRYLDVLHKAWKQKKPGNLGDNATADFILHEVFKIHPEQVSDDAGILKLLLELQSSDFKISLPFLRRVESLLHLGNRFSDWPLSDLLSSGDYFLRFLQERWPIFLADVLKQKPNGSRDKTAATYELSTGGPRHLPLQETAVYPFVTTLFLEGKLKPVKYSADRDIHPAWVQAGIQGVASNRTDRKLEDLLSRLESAVPSDEAAHFDWLAFAGILAQAEAVYYSDSPVEKDIKLRFETLLCSVDRSFSGWACRRLASLYNQPSIPPVMLHHVPRFMQYQCISSPGSRVALIVMDGLALGQWQLIRRQIADARADFKMDDDAVFAWVPCITSVCRQAIFSGRAPFQFASTIDSTGRDEYHWQQFWQQAGLGAGDVYYANIAGELNDLNDVRNAIDATLPHAVGIMVGMVDNIMHGVKLGMAGMYNQVKQWNSSGFLIDLLDLLLKHKYHVYLTADHGNVEAEGCGNPHEGVIAGTRSQRVRVYNSAVLREQTARNYPESICWQPDGLPDNYYPLLAPGRQAFINKGVKTVTHGGLSVEELIVPFVQIERRK